MEPFDENGTCFRDGSRWDWYTIGGRFTGLLDGYDPDKDPVNIETCDLCGGTGDRASWRNESRKDQHPSGCNGCSGTGKRVKFSYEPHAGDILQVKELNLQTLRELHLAACKQNFERALKCDPGTRQLLYHIADDDTLETYLAKQGGENPLSAYAFLRNRRWHESERMGWWGMRAKTECELAEPNDPDKAFGKCLQTNKRMGARIVVWNEPDEIWNSRFYKRFVQPLNPDDLLVVVDYHV